MPEDIRIRVKRDQPCGEPRVLVDGWPRDIEVSGQFLAVCDPAYLQRDGDMLTFTVDNGQAVYHLEDPSREDHLRDVCPARLVSCIVIEGC